MNARRLTLLALLVVVAASVVASLLLTLGARPDVVIGSKKFTESIILGEIARGLVLTTDHSAGHKEELGGTRILYSALRRGQIDLYPEYTGTILREILAPEGFSDIEQARAHLEERGIALSPTLGFNNTYAIAVNPDVARRLGLRTISDLSAHPDLKLGFNNEFMDRGDGWPALRRAYNLPHTDVRGMDHDLAYRAIDAGQIDVMDAYSTDAEIKDRGLVILEDDRGHFPAYDAVFLYRQDLDERAPEVIPLLESLGSAINEERMRALNERVKIGGQDESDVAAAFLFDRFDVAFRVEETPLARRILERTAEHIVLVAIPLALGLVVAIPLGIVAARRDRLGQGILGVFGIIQTIPSLALLALMIPIPGVLALLIPIPGLSAEDRPAIAALALYALLPLARGAHSGIKAIPPTIEESAEALGLTPAQRLLRIDLPLAGPAIMSGVKTAAVILIGFATLGALIGAGGYGQPIMTGIRLDSTAHILEGAIPAAGLAILAQALFETLERLVVPRGLRLKRAT